MEKCNYSRMILVKYVYWADIGEFAGAQAIIKVLGHQHRWLRLCPTLPFNDSVCLRLNIFFRRFLDFVIRFSAGIQTYLDVDRRR